MASSIPVQLTEVQPLQSRITRSSGRTPAVVPLQSISDRPPTYHSYSDENMLKAYDAVMRKEMSIRRAAEEYGVPRTTLQDRVSGKVGLKAQSGSGRRLLTDKEESRLAKFLIGCAPIGFAKSRKDILAIVQQILHAKGVPTQVTYGWWDSFQKRHPELTLRHAEPLSYVRAVANNPDVINNYFDLLEDTLHDNGLTNRPAQIFNCDETGMSFTHKPPKVVAGVRQRHPYAITSGDKSQITVLACGSAAGYTIPPMVIFDRKSLKLEMTEGEVPGTFYGLSDNGWMDSELFADWFKNHFLKHAPPLRPLILMLDGHSSHYQPNLIQTAASEGIIIFCLPPHTTHLLQPLDNGTFGSLKAHWAEECHRFCSQNPGKVVNRYNFSKIFHSAWVQGMSMKNVIASFKAVGVYPVNRDVVLEQLPGVSKDSSPPSVSLPFVPFLSPAKTPRHRVSHPRLPSHCSSTVLAPQNSIKATNEEYEQPVPLQPPSNHAAFTHEEEKKFRRRLEEGYDLPDPRYTEWLSTLPTNTEHMCRTHASINTSSSYRLESTLDTILRLPTPPTKRNNTTYSKGARVLTSEECRQELVQKEEMRKKKEEEKQRKKIEREKKAEERLKKMEKKAEEKQKRKAELEKKLIEQKKKAVEKLKKKAEVEKQKRDIEKEKKEREKLAIQS